MCDGGSEPFAKWGPDDRKPLLEAATLADGLAK